MTAGEASKSIGFTWRDDVQAKGRKLTLGAAAAIDSVDVEGMTRAAAIGKITRQLETALWWMRTNLPEVYFEIPDG